MAKIHKLTKNGQTIYPATTTDAVVDATSNKSLKEELTELDAKNRNVYNTLLYSSIKYYKGNIFDGKYINLNNDSVRHLIIPISEGDKISISTKSDRLQYCFLKTYNPIEGEIADIVENVMYKDNGIIITAPYNANFLYVYYTFYGSDIIPSICINGVQLYDIYSLINKLMKYNVIKCGNISANNKWENIDVDNTYKYLMIKICDFAGKKITVSTNNSLLYKYYAFLKSNMQVISGDPDFSEGTERMSGYPSNVTIPMDAKYLYLSISGQDGVIYLPTIYIDEQIVKLGVDNNNEFLRKDIDEIKKYINEVDEVKEKINIIDRQLNSVRYTDYTEEMSAQNGNISGSGTWANITNPTDNYKHVLVNVSDFVGLMVTATGNCNYKYYAFLKNIDNISNGSLPNFVEDGHRVSGYPSDITIPSDAKYLYLSVAGSDGIVHLPIIRFINKNANISYDNLKNIVGSICEYSEKIPFTVNVNIHVDIDYTDTTNIADKEVYSKDYCVLNLPNDYTNYNKPCKLLIFAHGAGGYVDELGNGEGDNIVKYFVSFGYAVLRVNGLPVDFYEDGMAIGGGFGIPISCNCYYKAYRHVVRNYNIDKNGCYLLGQSMGGLTCINLAQNYNIPIRAIALDAPLLSIENVWKSPTWAQNGGYSKSVWYLLSKAYNFSFDEVNSLYSKNYTLDTFPFAITNSEYKYDMIQYLYENNKNKINGYDPYTCNVVTIGDKMYKFFNTPIKLWRGAQDSLTDRLPYCRKFIEMINNSRGYAKERYPNTSKHCVGNATINDGIEQVEENGMYVSCVLQEQRIFLERF